MLSEQIKVHKLPDGWQAYKVVNGKVVVLDNYFEHEAEADV